MHNDTTFNALQVISHFEQTLADGKPDFKTPETLANARVLAEEILSTGMNYSNLVSLESEMCSPEMKPTFSNLIHLGVKLAKSKAALKESKSVHVSVILPAYGENVRMKPRGTGVGEDPNGENFIVEKHKQLSWLFQGTQSSYDVYIVDDMSKPDPVTSGKAAEDVINNQSIPHFNVLFLKDGVDEEKDGDTLVAKSLRGVESPKNTKKAGAVYYGSAKAIEMYNGTAVHIIVLTDCDLSVDIAQLGNLVKPIVDNDAIAAAGSRRLPESILEIESSRNLRANAARYFRELTLKGLLPKDTQCGAKAFLAEAMAQVISDGVQVLDFSFDIELLTKIALKYGPGKIKPVAVAWFDSAELTTTDSSVHFRIMAAQLAIAKTNKTGSGPDFEHAIKVSELLTSDESVWLQLLDRLKDKPDLIEKIQKFDPTALPELEKLAA